MEFYFSLNGRVSRGQLWTKFILPVFGISFTCTLLDIGFVMMTGSPLAPFGILFAIACFWPGIAVYVKRLHDVGMSGWWYLAFSLGPVTLLVLGFLTGYLLPAVVMAGMIALASLVIFYMLPGSNGPNDYGDDPRIWRPDFGLPMEGAGPEDATVMAADEAAETPPAPKRRKRRAAPAPSPLPAGPRATFGQRGL